MSELCRFPALPRLRRRVFMRIRATDRVRSAAKFPILLLSCFAPRTNASGGRGAPPPAPGPAGCRRRRRLCRLYVFAGMRHSFSFSNSTVISSARAQQIFRSPIVRSSGGSPLSHSPFTAKSQRGWNGHPGGVSSSPGTEPRIDGSRSPRPCNPGSDASSPCV